MKSSIMKMTSVMTVVLICVSFTPNSVVASGQPNAIVMASQRTYNVTKTSCPDSSCAVLKAEKANPGWKVVKIKELSKVWHLTLKKP